LEELQSNIRLVKVYQPSGSNARANKRPPLATTPGEANPFGDGNGGYELVAIHQLKEGGFFEILQDLKHPDDVLALAARHWVCLSRDYFLPKFSTVSS
jgi:hypothetical protein